MKFEELLLASEISDRGKHELKTIFYALTPDKKDNILKNFKEFIIRIERIEEEHRREQAFLLNESMDRMDKIVQKYEERNNN